MTDPNESRLVSAAAAGQCPKCGATRPDLSTACPACGAPPLGPAEPAPVDHAGRPTAITDALMQVRASDIEPYIALRYLSKLFRFMAVFVLILLVAEIVLGLTAQGTAAIGRLLIEMTQFVVFAGLLWGAGDLAILLIDIGHDVRAARILIGRQAAHHLSEHHDRRGDADAQAGRRDSGARASARDVSPRR